MHIGKVYIVGAGPGDPELITVKGKRAIQEADIIFYDRLINDQLLAFAKPETELVFCGKKPNYHAIRQETINHLLVKHALKGKVVTRLKGGDPFIYGRGGEEAEYLSSNQIPFEIIPGITAGVAAPAYAGIPVTHRDYSSSFAVITGHQASLQDFRWESLVNGIDTLVIYMGMKNLLNICRQLMKHGKNPNTSVALIQWGTTEKQRAVTGTLDTIVQKASSKNIKNPSIIVIGDVVKLSKKIGWFYPQVENVNDIRFVR